MAVPLSAGYLLREETSINEYGSLNGEPPSSECLSVADLVSYSVERGLSGRAVCFERICPIKKLFEVTVEMIHVPDLLRR